VPWHRFTSNYRNQGGSPHRFTIACFIPPRNHWAACLLPITSDMRADINMRERSLLMVSLSSLRGRGKGGRVGLVD
jgi:hypothetical protein